MVFSSLFFLYIFLPLCLLTYQLFSGIRAKNMVLLVFSLFFYAWGEPIWIIQMLLSGTLVFLFGLAMEKCDRDPGLRKMFLAGAVISALVPLIVFKYSGFFIENLSAITGLALPKPGFTMPIGISFYTFQVISYAVDLYRGQCTVQHKLHHFILYEALFPQLIAGPIVRYRDVEEQINHRTVTMDDLTGGCARFIAGLAKKTLIANYAGSIVSQTLAGGRLAQLSSLELLIGITAYTFQIYYDFSAYSDMAIGLGRMFGFHFKENFNYPYISGSVTDFWRRWHISLSTFFRDYLYIPLGGNRRRPWLNLFIVWFLTGFWHGASWNFIFWGLYFFVFIVLERIVLLPVLERLPRFVSWLYMVPIVVFGWAVFYFTSLADLGTFFGRVFLISDGSMFVNLEGKLLFKQNIIFFIIALIGAFPVLPALRRRLPRLESMRFKATGLYTGLSIVRNTVLTLLSTAALAGASFNPFLYFRF